MERSKRRLGNLFSRIFSEEQSRYDAIVRKIQRRLTEKIGRAASVILGSNTKRCIKWTQPNWGKHKDSLYIENKPLSVYVSITRG